LAAASMPESTDILGRLFKLNGPSYLFELLQEHASRRQQQLHQPAS
jgi:hypothetical protein